MNKVKISEKINYLGITSGDHLCLYIEIKNLSNREGINEIKSILGHLSYHINEYYKNSNNTERTCKLLIINIFREFIQIRLCNGYSEISRQISDNINYLDSLWELYIQIKGNYSDNVQNKIENLFGLCYSLYGKIGRGKDIFKSLISNSDKNKKIFPILNKLLYQTSFKCGNLYAEITKNILQKQKNQQKITNLIGDINEIYQEFITYKQGFVDSFDNGNTNLQLLNVFSIKKEKIDFYDGIKLYLLNGNNNLNYPQSIYIVIYLTILYVIGIAIQFNKHGENKVEIPKALSDEYNHLLSINKNDFNLILNFNESIEDKYIKERLEKTLSKNSGIIGILVDEPQNLKKALIIAENTIISQIVPGSCERYGIQQVRDLIRNEINLRRLGISS